MPAGRSAGAWGRGLAPGTGGAHGFPALLHSYIWQHIEIGYVQGMCDLLAPLLVILDDGEWVALPPLPSAVVGAHGGDPLGPTPRGGEPWGASKASPCRAPPALCVRAVGRGAAAWVLQAWSRAGADADAVVPVQQSTDSVFPVQRLWLSAVSLSS